MPIRTPEPVPNSSEDDFASSPLYKAVYSYVSQYMSRYDASHDFQHVLRVLATAKQILAKERQRDLSRALDEQLVILSALLHDVGDNKYASSADEAASEISTLLASNNCPAKLISRVNTVVENVSYSHEIAHPQSVQDCLLIHPELAIVQDADRLDAIGAVGIARTFAYGGAKASDRGLQGSIEHFTDKLERLEGMMKTEAGRESARERTRRLTLFRQWWAEEAACADGLETP